MLTQIYHWDYTKNGFPSNENILRVIASEMERMTLSKKDLLEDVEKTANPNEECTAYEIKVSIRPLTMFYQNNVPQLKKGL